MKENDYVGLPIRSLQKMLKTISLFDNTIHSPTIDGIYGKNTIESVRTYQNSHSLPVTGVTDYDTWTSIKKDYFDALNSLITEPLIPVLNPLIPIKFEQKNLNLYIIQSIFISLSMVYSNVPPVNVTGVLDKETKKAVLWLQEISSLPLTGEIDLKTWRILSKLYRVALQT